MTTLTTARIPAALAAHDQAQAASDEIRQKLGLDPVPENGVVRGWRAKLATAETKAADRSGKAPNAADARALAKAALQLAGHDYPATAGGVPALLAALEGREI